MSRDPTARALQLLSLLQSGARHGGTELAARLGVSTRTVRRDADRLRRLGYSIESHAGPAGSYRLSAGSSLPPLLFDEDEVTAVIAGLRLVQARFDDDDAAHRALTKLGRVLPDRLARRVHATDLATEVVVDETSRTAAHVVGSIADAVHQHGRIRFAYRDQTGTESLRVVDPYRHVVRGAHSYLVGFDLDRDDWRLYRADRMSELERVPGTFRRRRFPYESIERWFATDFGRLPG